MLKIKKTVTAGVVAAALVVSQTPAAQALVTPVTAKTVSTKHASTTEFSDADYLELLLAGQGDLVEANPELFEMLGFAKNKPSVDSEELQIVISDYLEFDPNFRKDIIRGITSSNPARVDKSLQVFAKKFEDFLILKTGTNPTKHMRGMIEPYAGKTRVEVNFWGVANFAGAVNVAAWSNVAVATLAVLVAGFVPAYIGYLPLEGSDWSDNKLEREAQIAKLTSALAS